MNPPPPTRVKFTQWTLLKQYEQVLYNHEFDFDEMQRDRKLLMLTDYGVIGGKCYGDRLEYFHWLPFIFGVELVHILN